MSKRRARVLHVITSLSTGGAETMLRNLALSDLRNDYETRVISLTTFDPIGSQLSEAGVVTKNLGAQNSVLGLGHWRELRAALVRWQPDLVHSWMYHANLAVGVLLATMSPSSRPIHVASVRAAVGRAKAQSAMTRVVRRLDSYLSRRAARIIFNSDVVRDQHCRIGYASKNAVVIPNGFDVRKFKPDLSLRAGERQRLGLVGEPLIGLVGRYHPVKGQSGFVEAAAILGSRQSACRFALIGPGCDSANTQLTAQLEATGLSKRFFLLGERADMPTVLNALDIVVSASISESFPNAIGEAMACGVPCIVTDLGGCAHLVGETGWVVRPGVAGALAEAMSSAIQISASGDKARSVAARERIRALFSLDRVIEEYRGLYAGLLASKSAVMV